MLDAAVDLIGKAGQLGSVVVTGTSMLPTFDGVARLAVEFSPPDPSPGDILLFRQSGTLVVHRLVQRSRTGKFRTRGDAKIVFDAWVDPGSVVGRAVALGYADGTWRNLRNFRARCYARALGLHGLVWGGLGAATSKFLGRHGKDWQWRLGRLDQFKLRLAHVLLFRLTHPRMPAPDFTPPLADAESSEARARCYTPRGKS